MDADRTPNIVHVVNSLAPGGMERTLVRLLHEWGSDDLRHTVVTLRAAGPLAEELPDHTACRALDISGSSKTCWWRLANVLRRLRPAVIHARGTGTWSDAVLASLLLPSTPIVLGFHGWDGQGPVTRSAAWTARLARRSGARILTVSQRARDRLAGEIGIDATDISVIPNGVDTRRFTPVDPPRRAALRQSLGITPGEMAIGIVGSLTPIKRHDLLLDAFASVASDAPSLVMVIAGDGPLRGALEVRAAALGIDRRVHFLGPRKNIATILPALDLYVCASDSEGQSNAVLEALACGLAIISTDVGDHHELIIRPRAGIVIPSGDPMALAKALRQLCAGTELRQKAGARARRVAERHDVETMARRYASFYRGLVPGLDSSASPASFPGPALACVP